MQALLHDALGAGSLLFREESFPSVELPPVQSLPTGAEETRELACSERAARPANNALLCVPSPGRSTGTAD